jgi:small-conductance mechanosensitive channel
MMQFLTHWQNWLWSLGIAVAAIVIGLLAQWAAVALLKRLGRKRSGDIFDLLARHGGPPARFILPLLALSAALPWAPLTARFLRPTLHGVGLGLIAAIAWLAVALIDLLAEFIMLRHTQDVTMDLGFRRIRTQVQVLRHTLVVLIVIIAISIMLMTFPDIRHVGESLFASAGLAALVAGLAARSTLVSLIAGLQIALTQPIRLEDAVVVEGEWGWIEEITTTYVVVRVWDLRRLVVPLSYFIEKPFQNWTRNSQDLLGTVLLYTDYSVPVEEVRQELLRVLQSSGQWDKKAWALEVTNADQRTLELRALMSASDSSNAWNLRCYVREKLIAFLQQRYPQNLPRSWVAWVNFPELEGKPDEAASTPAA